MWNFQSQLFSISEYLLGANDFEVFHISNLKKDFTIITLSKGLNFIRKHHYRRGKILKLKKILDSIQYDFIAPSLTICNRISNTKSE